MVHDTHDMPYTYKGESAVIPDVTGGFCPACGKAVLGAAESECVFRFTHPVVADISGKGEYRFYRRALTDVNLRRDEFLGTDVKTILKDREQELSLLKSAINTSMTG